VADHSGATIVFGGREPQERGARVPTGATAQIAMSRQEKYRAAAVSRKVSPATIQEDLRGRDFTCNAIALSLNKTRAGAAGPAEWPGRPRAPRTARRQRLWILRRPHAPAAADAIGRAAGLRDRGTHRDAVANAREAEVEKAIQQACWEWNLKLIGRRG